jgi:hypothetical protein
LKLRNLIRAIDGVIRKGKAGKPNEFGEMVKLQDRDRLCGL